jgi:hypothetical protein
LPADCASATFDKATSIRLAIGIDFIFYPNN